ncbi:MAG TPA: TldD/PmbA family protein [Candidatus Dormibacteraeota bacterium]|nr:TldD/PmbA family protein [Candidatus Dormibacteraeota bacterium]
MRSIEVAPLSGREQVEDFARRLLARSPADQTEVMVTEWDSALTRFANNGIHQNVAERNVSVRVRVVKDQRTGVATLNQMNEGAARNLLDRALAVAALQPPGEVVPMAGPLPAPEIDAWSEATAAASPEQRADFVGELCSQSARASLKAFGAYSTTATQILIANSLGARHHHRSTQATVNSVVMGEAGAGYADRSAIDIGELDAQELGTEVIDKAGRNQDAQPIEPGVYEVVLEEYAVAEMLEFLSFMGFGALAAQEERSFMRLGERITGESIAIWDDGLDRSGLPTPFDFEGVPKQRVDLIRNGVATGLVYDQLTATRAGRPSTGHGLPAPNTDGPFAVNLFMAPGSVPKAELLKGIKRGIWVTRFWYVRIVQPKASVITGMTREGTFLIENGVITRPVKDLRFTESILKALDGTQALSSSTKLQASEYFGASRVPALHLKGFTFTS